MTLTKNSIVESLQQTSGAPRTDAERYLKFILEKIKSTLASGEDVLISAFGKFCVHSKNERKGRNPANGEDLMLGARRVVRFSCSPKFREKVNGGRSE